jgi:NTP pyrophosphatase (non-canonical NTP hydrolase)
MGFFDKVKEKAGEIADDAGRATKVAQAQMKLKSLQGDVDTAKKELGDVAFNLIAGGELAHASLEAPVAKIREALGRVADKEAEIAAIKAAGAEPEAGAPVAPETPQETAADAGETPPA